MKKPTALITMIFIFIWPIIAIDILDFIVTLARCIVSLPVLWNFIKKYILVMYYPSIDSSNSKKHERYHHSHPSRHLNNHKNFYRDLLSKNDLLLMQDLNGMNDVDESPGNDWI